MRSTILNIFFYLCFIYIIKSYVYKKSPIIVINRKWLYGTNRDKTNLKINDIINFKNKKELKKEIVAHSKKLSLDLNNKQLNKIGNNLFEFFSYIKLMDMKINFKKKKIKRKIKLLPLCEKQNKYKKFHTQNMKKEGNYFITFMSSYIH
ncbi:conserved protein, unknown function [Hepatocystis sp. ex Piliocolobus tephrosceles]|nr:conserved protein, unknown function [Hepatocystis sp. ex Piliocolobus tephrosceles]